MSTTVQETSASPGRRIALVIGVNGPPVPGRDALKYAEQDATDMAQVLLDCGYKLFRSPLVGEQVTSENLRKSVIGLARNLRDGDLALIYFSGHGEAVTGQADIDDIYLVTHDYDASDLNYDPTAHQSMRWLRKILFEHQRAVDVVLILECCYAGNFGETSRDLYLDELVQRLRYYFDAPAATSDASKKGQRLALSATAPGVVAHERDGHGVMTTFLLQGLKGACLEVFDPNKRDCITFNSLQSFVEDHLPDNQKPWYYGAATSLVLAQHPGRVAQLRHEEQRVEREQRLRAMILDYQAFFRDRLSSFVGRTHELNEVRQEIARLQNTGGYLTITGPAGQGKSCLIARLIDEASQEEELQRIAYHFIPLSPGPDHQFALLRNVMARLILKYDLPDFYLDGQTTAALRDYFPKVLQQIADKGKREAIYIDGLDQLEEEGGGADVKAKRDLSFLPPEVPTGIVFVLGTRPDDTLAPLQLKKPLVTYQLRNLSRDDFDAILRHRGVTLQPRLADQFYHELDENALFLDLAAKELAERGQIMPEEVEAIIKQLAENPDKLFWLAIERLSQHEMLWEQVIKPLLGILLVTRRPLARMHMKHIINLHQSIPIDNHQLREGLTRLGGLVISDGQERYTLFHLKLRDYLHQKHDTSDDQKVSIEDIGVFDDEDVQRLHAWLADWCEQGDIAHTWHDDLDVTEQGRREYARYHYITHLFHAHLWQRLFAVLDAGQYGQAKVHWDPSTRLFAQDVELGQQAASWEGYTFEEGIAMLSRLWRYSLLHCSLGSRADRYPEAAFRLMTLLGQQQIAIGLAELVTDVARKVRVLCQIADQLRKQLEERRVWMGLLLRASDVAQNIKGEEQRDEAWGELAQALVQAGEWTEAERVIRAIKIRWQQAEAWRMLAQALAQAGKESEANQAWQEAGRVIKLIEDEEQQDEAWSGLAQALAQAGEWQEAERVIKLIEDEGHPAEARSKLAQALAQAGEWREAKRVIKAMKDAEQQAEAWGGLAQALAQAGKQTEASRVWRKAERIIKAMQDAEQQAEAWTGLAQALAQAGKQTEASRVWREAERVIKAIEDEEQQTEAWSELAQALAQAGEWREAERVIRAIERWWLQAEAWRMLAQALAQAGEWTEAERVIRAIEDAEQQASALRALGQALAQAGKWQEAERVIRAIKDEWRQDEALRMLAQALAQAGKGTEASQVWREAERVIKAIKSEELQAEAWSRLAQALAQAGEWQEAERVIKAIAGKELQAEAWSGLVQALAQAGKRTKAERVIRAIEDAEQQASALRALGQALAQAGEWTEAERVIKLIEDEWRHAEALRMLAQTLAQAGEWTEAGRVRREAERVIKAMKDEEQQAEAWSGLAQTLAQAGEWREAERVIRAIEDEELQAEAWSRLAQALAQAGEWQEAERVIRAIEDEELQAEAWRMLAQALAQAGEWREAERVIRAIEDEELQAETLRALGQALAQAVKYEELLRLIWQLWQFARTRDEAFQRFGLAIWLIPQHPKLGMALFEGFSWVDDFFKG